MLAQSRLVPFRRDLSGANADFHILLTDATKLFCQAVSDVYGELEETRWSPAIAEVLLAFPERCEETLKLLEAKDFKKLSLFQFAAA